MTRRDQALPAPKPGRRATLPRHPASRRQTDNHPPRMTLPIAIGRVVPATAAVLYLFHQLGSRDRPAERPSVPGSIKGSSKTCLAARSPLRG